MPVIMLADAEANGATYRGTISAGLSIQGAPGAVIVHKARVQTIARLTAALDLLVRYGHTGTGASSRYLTNAGWNGRSPLVDQIDSRNAPPGTPGVGPIGRGAFDRDRADPQIVMFTYRDGWSTQNVADSMSQGPTIPCGVAIVVDWDVGAPQFNGGVFTAGRAGAIQALTGVLA